MRNRTIATITAMVFATTASALAHAGWVQGRVTRIYTGPELAGKIAFKVRAELEAYPREGRPACAIYDEWAIDGTTDAGRQTYQLLLEAKRQFYLLEVYGTGACTLTGDREDVRFLYSCREFDACLP